MKLFRHMVIRREREWTQVQQDGQPGKTDRTAQAKRTYRETVNQREQLEGKRLQNGYRGGGVLRDTESSGDTEDCWNAESSHRDKHCKEQTNSLDGKDGPRVRDRTGVVDGKLSMPNRGGYNRTPNGGTTNRRQDGDTNCEDSEPG